jgi:hypothetical protein
MVVDAPFDKLRAHEGYAYRAREVYAYVSYGTISPWRRITRTTKCPR